MFPPNTRILIVDDSENIRVLVKKELTTLAFTGNFLEADNGDEAFSILVGALRSPSPVELVISDWNMPGTTGFQFLTKVRSFPELKNLPFLMVTSESDPSQVLDAVGAGVSNYILKPFDANTLKQKLQAVWKKHNGG